MFDSLAERRKRKADAQYQAKHGAGVETQREMEQAAAKQRHPSAYKPKHGKHEHRFITYGTDSGVLIAHCIVCGVTQAQD